MQDGTIIVNHDYQRSERVWPPAARSYLLDTVLTGFPIPKLSLYQRTDLKSRRTIEEIVDGQQRSMAFRDFYNDHFRITGSKNAYSGMLYSQLPEDAQEKFIGYNLSVDIFIGATPNDIREVFRRINSYTVPLNAQEERNAVYQGAFKWFMVELSKQYSQTLKDIGTFNERQLIRMQDIQLFSEVTLALMNGIATSAKRQIDNIYEQFEAGFPQEGYYNHAFDTAFEHVVRWKSLHGGPLMKANMMYALILAIVHILNPVDVLNSSYTVEHPGLIDDALALVNLGLLASALDTSETLDRRPFVSFIDASGEGTNTRNNRSTRFEYLCRAIEHQFIS